MKPNPGDRVRVTYEATWDAQRGPVGQGAIRDSSGVYCWVPADAQVEVIEPEWAHRKCAVVRWGDNAADVWVRYNTRDLWIRGGQGRTFTYRQMVEANRGRTPTVLDPGRES